MNVLSFFAHPDDETMLIGGTLAILAQQGAQVHFLCATRGEGGEVGEPPVCRHDELGMVRTAELECAIQALGGSSLTFLGYRDPRVGPSEALYAFTEDQDQLIVHIIRQVRRRPDAIITHGSNGEYGHPAHMLAHTATLQAVRRVGPQPPWVYSVAAMFPGHPKPRLANQDDPATFVIDVTSVMDRKTQAALCHRTQHALFVRRASKEAKRQLSVPEVLMRQESLHCAFSPDAHPGREVVPSLLNKAGVIIHT